MHYEDRFDFCLHRSGRFQTLIENQNLNRRHPTTKIGIEYEILASYKQNIQ